MWFMTKIKSFKSYLFLLISGLLILGFASCTHKIDSTESMIKEIVNRYNGKWFKQIKFSHTTSFYENDSVTRTESWIEEYNYPSQLIIKTNAENSSDGQLYRNDSIYIFEDNVITLKKKMTHDLVILSLDIYSMPLDEIMNRFESLDYDISKFRVDTYNGRKVYVIGADKGDNNINQIWYDAENLLLIKMIKNTPNGLHEISLNNYINIDGQGWIEQEMVVKINSKLFLTEKYYNIQIPEGSKSDIKVSDFRNFNISVEKSIQYIIQYGINTQGKRFIMMLMD